MKNASSNSIKKMALLILIIYGFMTEEQSFSQSRESLVKAGYIEKFTHFVQWPVASNKNDSIETFTIAVIGKNIFGQDLEELFSKTKVKNYKVKITYISSVDEIDNCMILFISGSEINDLDKILHYTTGRPILTISDSKGFGLNGVIINMFTDGNYIRYEINRSTLEKSGLKINSLLLNYAVIIKSDV
jgi:hypothetical protein